MFALFGGVALSVAAFPVLARILGDRKLHSPLGVIFAVACIRKFGGAFIAARLTGLSAPDSALLGALMNTRGLMELIVLLRRPRPARPVADPVRDVRADGDRHDATDHADRRLARPPRLARADAENENGRRSDRLGGGD